MPTNKEQVKDQVKKLQDKVDYSSVTKAASDAQSTVKNATQTAIGTKVNEIKGGLQSVSSKVEDVKNSFNSNPVEGLLSSTTNAISGSIDDTLNTVASSLGFSMGTGLTVQWSDPDSDGHVYPISSSLQADVNSTLSAIISLISGLGAGKTDLSGFAQEVVSNASPAGLKSSLETVVGKVGALGSVDQVASLANQANTLIQNVQTKVNSSYSDLVDKFPSAGAAAASNIGDMSNAFNNVVTETSSSVTGATGLLDTPVSLNYDGLLSDMNSISDSSVTGEEVYNSVFNLTPNVTKIGSKAQTYIEQAETVISNSSTGLIQGFVSQLGGEVESLRQTYPQLNEDEAKRVIDLSQGNAAEKQQAAELIHTKAGVPVTDAKARLLKVNTTIAGQIVVDNEKSAFSNPFSFARNDWNKGKDNPVFEFITTVEELEAELRSSDREITEVVVHWTETYTNKNIGAEELNSMHIDLGLNGIAYHYVIRRDGSLQRGRPISEEGEHADINGHNKYSIGIAFVGGFNCASGTPNPETFLSSQSLTRAQMSTFDQFCRAFYKKYPGGQILGHNDIDINEIDPGFDVIEYCRVLFNKESIFDNTLTQGPFSPHQLITKRIVT